LKGRPLRHLPYKARPWASRRTLRRLHGATKVIQGVTLFLEVVILADGPGGGFPGRILGGHDLNRKG
jgi:hypothetical protein